MKTAIDIKEIVKNNDTEAVSRLFRQYGLRRDCFYPITFTETARINSMRVLVYASTEISSQNTIDDEFVDTILDYIGMVTDPTILFNMIYDKTIKEFNTIPIKLRNAIKEGDYYARVNRLIEDMDKNTLLATISFIMEEAEELDCRFAPAIIQKVYHESLLPRELVLFVVARNLVAPYDIIEEAALRCQLELTQK